MVSAAPTITAPVGPTTILWKSADEPREAFRRAVHGHVAQGAPVESQGDYQWILVKGHRVNHILLVLTLVTLGTWGIVWLALLALRGERRMSVNGDESGNTPVAAAGSPAMRAASEPALLYP